MDMYQKGTKKIPFNDPFFLLPPLSSNLIRKNIHL